MFGPFPSGVPCDDETLIVNAWDPHSLVGNGNAADNSLDGFVGRHTAVAVLCWPAVNTRLRYVPIP